MNLVNTSPIQFLPLCIRPVILAHYASRPFPFEGSDDGFELLIRLLISHLRSVNYQVMLTGTI
jgi:hypothetical protein